MTISNLTILIIVNIDILTKSKTKVNKLTDLVARRTVKRIHGRGGQSPSKQCQHSSHVYI